MNQENKRKQYWIGLILGIPALLLFYWYFSINLIQDYTNGESMIGTITNVTPRNTLRSHKGRHYDPYTAYDTTIQIPELSLNYIDNSSFYIYGKDQSISHAKHQVGSKIELIVNLEKNKIDRGSGIFIKDELVGKILLFSLIATLLLITILTSIYMLLSPE